MSDSPQSPSPVVDEPSGLPFLVAGVGASAGGLDAYTELLEALTADPGVALMVVSHLDPDQKSQLTEILGRASKMPVHEVTEGMKVEINNVYVIPPGTNMAMTDGHLTLTPRPPRPVQHMPIDHFLRSLAAIQKERAVGIILSGNGSDGAIALQAIKAVGGVTFAQDEATARYPVMPRSAVLNGSVDHVLRPRDIAPRTRADRRSPVHPPQRRDGRRRAGRGQAARRHRGPDAVPDEGRFHPLQADDRAAAHPAADGPPQLAGPARVPGRPSGATPTRSRTFTRTSSSASRSSFATPRHSRRSRRRCFRQCSANVPTGPICASGWPGVRPGKRCIRWPWSRWNAWKHGPENVGVKILATDLNETALETARAGFYLDNIEIDVSPARLRRFFVRHDGHYQISKAVREICVFSRHNLTTDPPFSRLDLVSCRNVLIYMDAALQRRVLPLLHYALNPDGFLFLGSSENAGLSADLFQVVDAKNRIFVRVSLRRAAPRIPRALSRRPRAGLHCGKTRRRSGPP